MLKTAHPSYVIFGAPGSGKTTHGRMLASLLNPSSHFVDMSRVCKVASAFDTSFGNLFAECSSKGELVPDEEILPRFERYMQSINKDEPIVASGIFRMAAQVHFAFQKVEYFMEGLIPFVVAKIKLTADDAVLRQRKRAEEDIAAGRTPRPTDLDEVKNRRRVEIYEAEVEGVLTAFRQYCDFKVIEVDSKETVQETFISLATSAGHHNDLHLKLIA
ncbi:MAG: hypothetical protein K9M11_01430 [Candidatus Pacebacteria bacterium]|nr:hypothetical protein [Candidatus Paceibacterota bacterium]